jgi:hypothetical protein
MEKLPEDLRKLYEEDMLKDGGDLVMLSVWSGDLVLLSAWSVLVFHQEWGAFFRFSFFSCFQLFQQLFSVVSVLSLVLSSCFSRLERLGFCFLWFSEL